MPPTSWAGCVAACQANGDAGYDAMSEMMFEDIFGVNRRRSATIASMRNPAEAALVSSLLSGSSSAWIGFNGIEQPGWSWAADSEMDATVDTSWPRTAGRVTRVAVPWTTGGHQPGDDMSQSMAVDGLGCEACTMVAHDRDNTVRLHAEPCDGEEEAHCMCEFSRRSATQPTLDARDDSAASAAAGTCEEDRHSVCSNHDDDCCAPEVLREGKVQPATCRVGYTPVRTTDDAPLWCQNSWYKCCVASSPLVTQLQAAYDRQLDDHGRQQCVRDKDESGGVLLMLTSLIHLVGFLIAACCCARRQLFSTPLHGCWNDVGGCCLTCWCPCVTWGKVAAFVWPEQLSQMLGCCLYCCCNSMSCCLGMVSRAELRKQLGVLNVHSSQGGGCTEDCCIHCCAHGCALCQESREIDLVHSGGRALPAPMQMQPMSVPAQLPQLVTVVCPDGYSSGQQVSVQLPSGGTIGVAVPLGVKSGQVFQVQAPAATQAHIVQGQVVQAPATVRQSTANAVCVDDAEAYRP